MKRRLLTGDIDITECADAIHRAAFHGEGLPRGWRVIRTLRPGDRFGGRTRTGHAGNLGRCAWTVKTVMLYHRAWYVGGLHSERAVPGGGLLAILIHEFIHMRCPDLDHGKEFDLLTRAAYDRVWTTS